MDIAILISILTLVLQGLSLFEQISQRPERKYKGKHRKK